MRKSFGAVPVIRGVDIAIADREFVALVGPSGCGKSTLLRMIAGLEDITAGEICIGDTVVNDVPPMDRDVAMVFQSYALYPHMTAEGNMSFSLRLKRRAREFIAERVGQASQMLNLPEFLKRLPRQLSGGQRQRVAMGRALVREPQVFLFDEPLSNLDAKLRVQMRAEIRSLHLRLEATSIYVTHDQVEAMTMADRIVVMRDGIVEQAGSPLDVYDHPVNLFVAGFIGSPSMNFLTGAVRRSDGTARVALPDGQQIGVPEGLDVAEGQPVVVGVRPEHLAVSETGDGLRAAIKVIEPTGAETHIVSEVGGDPLVAVTRDRLAYRPGQPIVVHAEPAHLHVFDRETGVALEHPASRRTQIRCSTLLN